MKLFNKENLKRIALSVAKAFAAAAVAYVVANEADLTTGNLSAVKGFAFAALVAGLDGAAKALQVALES